MDASYFNLIYQRNTTMYRTDLVRRVAKNTRLSQRLVSEVMSSTLEEVERSLAKGEQVQLLGFGTFYTRNRAESQALDFKTKERIKIPSMRVAGFKPSSLLKKAVRDARVKKSRQQKSNTDSQ